MRGIVGRVRIWRSVWLEQEEDRGEDSEEEDWRSNGEGGKEISSGKIGIWENSEKNMGGKCRSGG
jgi:hypothetical protein